MKIAYVFDVIYPYSKGGVERRIWEMARLHAQRGHEVTIFGMKYWPGEDIIFREDVRLWGVCPPQELYAGRRRSIKEAIYFAGKVLPPLLRERFDIIDASNAPYFPCFSAKLASVVRRSRLVITWHEVWDDYWYEYLGKKGIFGKGVERIAARLTDKVVAVSERAKEGLARIGVTKNIKVIPNGIDYDKIEKIKKAQPQSNVIFAGRLIRDKNVDVLIRAISLVRKEFPDIRCVVIGDGPERSSLEKLAGDLEIADNIRFTGFLEDYEDVIAYMKSSEVFVLPSTREGFGIVVLEANACGLPVITVNHERNAARTLITKENGFICELSEDSLAKTILMGLRVKKDMREKCVEKAKRYDWASLTVSAERFYESLGSHRDKLAGKDRLKIAYVFDLIYPYSKGGVERRTWEMARLHAQRGHEVTIFGMKSWPGEDIIFREDVRLWGVCPPQEVYAGHRRSIKEAIYFAGKVLPPLLRERFDIINASNAPYFPCFSAKICSIFKRTPLVISWWEIWADYWYQYLGKRGIFGKIIERITARLPRQIVVETNSNKEVLVSWGCHPDRVAVIPSGVSFDEIQKISPVDDEKEKTDVIFVGRLVSDKGVHTLLESVAHLGKDGQGVTAGIIGDGPEMENLKTLARELDIEERIRFFGRVEDQDRVLALMKGAKVFVYAAIPGGGWSLALVEANACGLPVVSVRSGVLGTNEAVIDGYNGFLVEEQSPELIAEKIALILENDQLREELRSNALSFARSLDWKNQTESLEKVYLGLVKNRG